MRSLWKACEGVETLIIEDADEVSVDNLIGCKRASPPPRCNVPSPGTDPFPPAGLTHLLLVSSQIIPSTTSRLPNFPSITHLTLSSITFHTTSHRSLLSPTTFPSLTHLSLSDSVLGNAGLLGYRIKPFPGLPNPASTSGSFLPTIQVLAIGRHLDGDAELDLSTCESLKAISIGRCYPAKKVLGTLREPGVEVLRVEEGPEGGGREGKARVKELRDDVVAMLELGIPVVKGLKELVVPVGWMEDERLRGLCEAKGVRMRVDDVGDDALTRARFWGLGGLDKTS